MRDQMKSQVKRLLKAIFLKRVIIDRNGGIHLLFRRDSEKTIKIKDISLIVNWSDIGGRAYASRSSHEEYVSPLYDEIASCLDPKLVIDVGANYGFTGMIFAKRLRN